LTWPTSPTNSTKKAENYDVLYLWPIWLTWPTSSTNSTKKPKTMTYSICGRFG